MKFVCRQLNEYIIIFNFYFEFIQRASRRTADNISVFINTSL
jgi:hypothetical protein